MRFMGHININITILLNIISIRGLEALDVVFGAAKIVATVLENYVSRQTSAVATVYRAEVKPMGVAMSDQRSLANGQTRQQSGTS